MELSQSAHIDTFCRDKLPDHQLWPEFTLAEAGLDFPDRLNCAAALLDEGVTRFGSERPCVLAPGVRWTYGELLRHANTVAQVLVNDCGLTPGNRVLLYGPNTPWLVACWFGVLKAGGVAVAAASALRRTELATMCEISRPGVALCDARSAAELRAAEVSGLRVIEYGGSEPTDLVARAAAKSGEFATVATACDDVAVLAFTSGTTGRPKATMHFHRDLLACAETFSKQVLRPEPDDLFTGTPPLAFTFGLGGLVVFPLHCGAATLLLERTSPAELAKAIEEFGVTVLFTAPTAYRAMVASGVAEQLRGLRRCVSAGEPLPVSVWQSFRDATGQEIIDGIGSTELLHIFISARPGDIRPGSTGTPVPGYQAVILDGQGNPAPDGQPGRLAVRGPTGCRYLADDRQADYVRDGWNLTGDTFVRDADGYFWYQARSDDMIVSAGYNIAGPEVEFALLRHPDVEECAVIGAPDEERGHVVAAFVVLRAGAPADEAKATQLQDFVKAQIAPYKYPRVVRFLAELPRTSTGKVRRFALRGMTSE